MMVRLVRLAENREIVGIFWGATADALWDAVDECTDPGACEYLTLSEPAGIMWPSQGAPALPLPEPDEDTGEDGVHLWEGAGTTGCLYDALRRDKGWKPMPNFIERHADLVKSRSPSLVG